MMRWCIYLFFILNPFSLKAQSKQFETALYESIYQFNHIERDEQYQPVLNQFIAISAAFPKEWLPYYYAAIVQTKIALLDKHHLDALVDDAIVWIEKCKNVQVNDEVLCAESFAYTVKMSAHPTWRWLSYQDKIKMPLALAKKMNPNNPRIYVLQANLEYHLPIAFGGGCQKALPIAKQAEKLLSQEKGKWKCLPTWGYTSIKEILNSCKF